MPQQQRSKKEKKQQQKMRSKSKPSVSRRSGVPIASSQSTRTNQFRSRVIPNGIEITHSELIDTLTSTTNHFEVKEYPMNPGLSVFPWLSMAALPWQQYKWIELRVQYLNRVASTHNGSVIGAFEYDVNQPIPDTETIMSAYQGCQEASVWKDLTIRLNPAACHPAGARRYVRTADVDDLSNYDGAKLLMGSVGSNLADLSLGKIWVHYKIQLYIPQAQPLQNPPTDGAKRQYNNGTMPSPLAVGASADVTWSDLSVDKIKEYLTQNGAEFTATRAMKLRAFARCAANASTQTAFLKCALAARKNGTNESLSFVSSDATAAGQTASVDISSDTVFDLAKGDKIDFQVVNSSASDASANLQVSGQSLLFEFLGFGSEVSNPAVLLSSAPERKSFPPPSSRSEPTKLARPEPIETRKLSAALSKRMDFLEETLRSHVLLDTSPQTVTSC